MEKFLTLPSQYRRLAREDLAEAELLLKSHFYLGAASRAYYACLHTMHSLLAEQGVQTKSHRQTHIEFRKRFIKEGHYGTEVSVLIDQLFSLRQSSDDDPFFSVTPETFRDILQRAKAFVRAVCGESR